LRQVGGRRYEAVVVAIECRRRDALLLSLKVMPEIAPSMCTYVDRDVACRKGEVCS